MVAAATSQLNVRMDTTLVGQIEGWHSQLFALAEVERPTYVFPTDEELDEVLYDEWLARDGKASLPNWIFRHDRR